MAYILCCVGLFASCVCCIGSGACHLCCKTTSANATRTSYVVMFMLAASVAWIMLASNIGRGLNDMSDITGDITSCQNSDDSHECTRTWSQLAVYRIMFGTAIFFAFHGILMIGVKNSKQDCRGGWQNGFWLFKILMWIGLIVAAFFIPNNWFFNEWGYIGISGAFLYMILQGAYVIIFANLWAKEYIKEDGNGCAKCTVPMATLIFYALVITITVCLYVYYTYGSDRGGCERNKFLISFNLILCLIMGYFGVASKAEDRGLLQPAVVSFYITYLTWSAVGMTTDQCLPNDNDTSDWLTIVIGFFLTIFVVMGISNIRNEEADKRLEQKVAENTTVTKTTNEDGEKVTLIKMYPVLDNEEDAVYYNWALFHWTLAFACFFMQNVLTNWATLRTASGQATSSEIDVGESTAPIWVQAVASWITVLFYLWSVLSMYIGPACCPSRDWTSADGTRTTTL